MAVQETIEREGLLDAVASKGAYLKASLKEKLRGHPYVGDIRGRGLLIGLELVENLATKATFDPVRRIHAKVKQEAMSRGLLVYPSGGTVDGTRGDHVLVAPPYIVQQSEMDTITELLRRSVDAATGAG